MTATPPPPRPEADAAPAADTPKLVLADYLDEHDDPRTAAALRWCVARRRWPRITARRALFIWYADPTLDHPGRPAEVARAMLPLAFLLVGQRCDRCADFQRRVGGGGVAYRSLPDAIDYLGYVLATLRWLTDPTASEAEPGGGSSGGDS